MSKYKGRKYRRIGRLLRWYRAKHGRPKRGTYRRINRIWR
ncbi:hypothetical protein [Peromfec virus RodF8_50]|uniref:Uncharacterized protein n=1 Tax=Peromfec virus RodF8_50 TaxID=2929380 RepID=A0A976N2Q1_9VIRU|nr:hypothetical protein [Peromfec virus RodF8_50]